MSIIATLNAAEAGKITTKYKSSNFNFPSHEKINPEEKQTPGYCKQVASAAFSALLRNRTTYPGYSYDYMQTLRDYGSGKQSMAYYLNKIKDQEPSSSSDSARGDRNNQGESKREGLGGLNEQVISIATNLKNAIHGMMEQYEEDIFVDAIDNDSGAEEERAMFEAIFDIQLAPFTKMIEEQYGVPLTNESPFPSNTTAEEIEQYKETGGFKTFWAENMEECIKHTEIISDWDRTIKRKFIDDGLDLNFMAARCVFDHSSGKEKWEYVDPANFCIQYSNDRLFNDAEYAGYFTLEKIGKLTELGFDSKELVAAARKYEYLFDNPVDVDWSRYSWTNAYDNKVFDFKVPVFHFSWIDVDVKKQVKYTSQYGKTSINEIGFDDEVPKVNNNARAKGISYEPLNTRKKRAYQCSWVIDSDMVYDFGLVPNQTLKGKGEAQLPFFAWRGLATNRKMIFGSVIESIVPFLDHLQLAWLKYQDALAKAHPGGYALNLRLLQNLKMGGKKLDPLDAYKWWRKSAIFPYMDTPIGETYKGGAVMPISRIEGTQGEFMGIFQAEIRFVSDMIDKLTGITPVSLGAAPDKDTAVSIQKMASAGTNNVIRPFINGMFEVKRLLAEQTSKRLPLLFRNVKSSRESYGRVIGSEGVAVIEKASRNGAEYGLTMSARLDIEAKERLYQMVDIALARGRDGEASISLDQAMYIRERIESGGNEKKLQRDVAFMISKAEEKAFAEKQAIVDRQSQAQTQQKQAEQQGLAQMKQMELQNQITLGKSDTENKAYLIQLEANIAYEKDIRDRRAELVALEQQQPKGI